MEISSSEPECWGEVSGELARDGRSNIGSFDGLDRCAVGEGEENGSESESCMLDNALSFIESVVGR